MTALLRVRYTFQIMAFKWNFKSGSSQDFKNACLKQQF